MLFFVLLLQILVLAAQESLLEKAHEAFQAQNYPLALEFLHKAREEAPGDAEVYYYLGYYSHYIVYDSRPFSGQGMHWSQQQVIANLERALELDSTMGNARYFLGVEHISRAWEFFKQGQVNEMKQEYQAAFDKGGLPAWMLEEGRNHLRACPPDAILFINGDLHHNAITWLQIMEGYRRDVSVVTLALLGRPWHARFYRDGFPGIQGGVPLSWSDNQVGEIHHYKWRPQQIVIPVPPAMNQELGVDAAINTMQWMVEPDLISPGQRTFMSPLLAGFVDIIEQNQWRRPVFISMGAVTALPVDSWRRQHGPLVQLIPFNARKHQLEMNVQATRDFYFTDEHFKDFPDLLQNDFPRVSGVMFNHHIVLLNLCRHYYDQQQWDLALEALYRIREIFPSQILPIPDDFQQFMNELEEDILQKRQ